MKCNQLICILTEVIAAWLHLEATIMEVHVKICYGLEDCRKVHDSLVFLKDVYDHLCDVTHRYWNMIEQRTWRQQLDGKRHQITGDDYMIRYEVQGHVNDSGDVTARIEAIVTPPMRDVRRAVAVVTEDGPVPMETDRAVDESKVKKETRRLTSKRRCDQREVRVAPSVGDTENDVRSITSLDTVARPIKSWSLESRDCDVISPVDITTSDPSSSSRGVRSDTTSLNLMMSSSSEFSPSHLPITASPPSESLYPPRPLSPLADSPNRAHSFCLFDSPSDHKIRKESPLFGDQYNVYKLNRFSTPASKSTDHAGASLTSKKSAINYKTEIPKVVSKEERRKKKSRRLASKADLVRDVNVPSTIVDSGTSGPNVSQHLANDDLPTIKCNRQYRKRVTKNRENDVGSQQGDKEVSDDRAKKVKRKLSRRKTGERKTKAKSQEIAKEGRSEKTETRRTDKSLDRWLNKSSIMTSIPEVSSPPDQFEDLMPPHSPYVGGSDVPPSILPPTAPEPDSTEPERIRCLPKLSEHVPKVQKTNRGVQSKSSGKDRKLPKFSESDSDSTDLLPTFDVKVRTSNRTRGKSPIFQKQSTDAAETKDSSNEKRGLNWKNISNMSNLSKRSEISLTSVHERMTEDSFSDDAQWQNEELDQGNSSQELPDLTQTFRDSFLCPSTTCKGNGDTENADDAGCTGRRKRNEMTDTYAEAREELSSPENLPPVHFKRPQNILEVEAKTEYTGGVWVKTEPEDWSRTTGSQSPKCKRRISVADMRRSLNTRMSPDVTRCDVTESTAPDVIEIPDSEESAPLDAEVMDRQIELVSDVKELTEEQLIRLIQRNKFYLRDIVRGKIPCERHRAFQKGGRARVNLTGDVYLQRYLEEQDDVILSAVMDIFSRGTLKHSEYVFKVLFPEILIRIFQEIHHIQDYDEAVDEMLNVDFDVDAPLGFG